ncbi:MAG: hypothetical protein SYC29_18755 [Planctomycetota bacterium]|nr:hypothetical protein [Planctomycetota bacterium]
MKRKPGRHRWRIVFLLIAVLVIAAVAVWRLSAPVRVAVLCAALAVDAPTLRDSAHDRLRREDAASAAHLVRWAGRDWLDADFRAELPALAAAIGDDATLDAVEAEMLGDRTGSFSLVVLEYLKDEQIPAVDDWMIRWLDDEAVAWSDDAPRHLRRCDLAAYYFRRDLGHGRWDRVDCLAADVAARDAFRERARAFLVETGRMGQE